MITTKTIYCNGQLASLIEQVNAYFRELDTDKYRVIAVQYIMSDKELWFYDAKNLCVITMEVKEDE